MRNPTRPLARPLQWLALVASLAFACHAAAMQADAPPPPGMGDRPASYRTAVVALVKDAKFRAQLEDSLVTKGRTHGFDLVASHQLVADTREFAEGRPPALLRRQGISVIVMVRPASVGAGVTLESVRDSLPPGLYSQMHRFADQTSPADVEDLIAVVHVAIYSLATDEPTLVTAGAVWLNEPVATREEGIAKLEDMLLQNVEAAREQIKRDLDRAAGL
jgi:hypothetical protein